MSPADPAHTGSATAAGSGAAPVTGSASAIGPGHVDDPGLAPAPSAVPVDRATQRVLDERYGSTQRRSFDRRFAYGIAGALVAAGLAFLFFSGWQTTSQVSWQDIGYTNVSDRELDVKFEITAPVDTPVACAVEAISSSKGTVGWNIVEVPPSKELTHTITTRLVIANEAVAATARECWVVTYTG